MRSFGQKVDPDALRRAMELRSWSQVDLAHKAGISQPTVSAALAGKLISPKSKRLIEEALGRHRPSDIAHELMGEPA